MYAKPRYQIYTIEYLVHVKFDQMISIYVRVSVEC